MRICFICTEIFAWGKYGGFGRATRIIGRELVKRGIEVCAVVPQRKGQNPVESLDGITIYSYPTSNLKECFSLLKKTNADIYHSEQPSLGTYLALCTAPKKKHLITFIDPKSFADWILELKSPSVSRLRSFLAFIYENNFLVKRAVNKADGIYCCAKYLKDKVRKVYSIKGNAEFLATPILLPDKEVIKEEKPTVCFVARWDRRKRPARFFEIAKHFPDVTFIAPGKSQDAEWDKRLRDQYDTLPNVQMPGFVDQFSGNGLWEIYSKSWILINTSTREGLPTSFLEALAYKCALLSQSNPEDVTINFGYHVEGDEYEEGLRKLLENNTWQEKGEAGHQYVLDNYELKRVIDEHISLYKKFIRNTL